jgi:amino acid adenylation domain-containing protein
MNVFDIINLIKEKGVSLSIENGNISLKGNTKQLSKDLLDLLKSRKQEILDFFKHTSSFEKDIIKTDKKEKYPLSNAQKRIWILSQFEGGNKAYNIATSFYLKGKIDLENLEKAFRLTIKKHETLRTVYKVEGDEAFAFIQKDLDFTIKYEKWNEQKDIKKVLKNKQEVYLNFEFDLEKGPLFFANLFQFSENEFAFFFTMHHIISDGWSMGVFVQEVMDNYKRICLRQDVVSNEEYIQYTDYVQWLDEKLRSEDGKRDELFWKNKMLGDVEPIQLPLDFKRPETTSFEGASFKTYFSKDFHQSINDFSKLNSTTLFNLYRAAFSIVLHKYSNQNEIIIGSPISGRTNQKLYNQIGLYVNTLPLKSDYSELQTFKDYLKIITEDSINCFERQDFPLDKIIELSVTNRSINRNALFDVLLVVQNNAINDGSIDVFNQHGFSLKELDKFIFDRNQNEKTDVPSKFDISINFSSESGGEYLYEIEYKSLLFRKETIYRLSKSFEYVLKQVIENNVIHLKDIQIVSVEEKQVILNSFNKPIGNTSENSLNELLDNVFKKYKDKVALKYSNKTFTYAELDQKVNATVLAIIKKTRSKSCRIALLLDRTEHIMFSVLGILRANCTYVPVDINYPESRVNYIFSDADPTVIIVDDKGKQLVPKDFNGSIIHVNEIDKSEEFRSLVSDQREETAYLIYTSGSTGAPKGVEITHRNAIAFLKWCLVEYSKTPYQTLLASTSYCFDLSVFEMFLPLLQGKIIRILNSGNDIPEFIHSDKDLFINTVPSVVRLLIDQKIDFSNVVALNMAGEPVPMIFKKQLDYKKMEVRNLYGPSEDTTYSTIYRFTNDRFDIVPIGVPVGYTQLYILDNTLNILPIGVVGEICLSGESIAKGYLNKEELTNEKFIVNPFDQKHRLYKTGDLGRWLPDGQVEFVGRKDDQVKVRGYRIELGEIQFNLENIPEIKQAVVVVSNVASENVIVAYYETNSTIDKKDIEQSLKNKLPSYMLPSFMIELKKIPLNSNGKVDKKQLPAPEIVVKENKILPATDSERKLFSIWKEVLGIEDFGITDQFFELGGHSLKATRVKALIFSEFKKKINLNDFFQHSTILTQAALIDSKEISSEDEIKKAEIKAHYPTSLSQERVWVLNQFEEASKAFNIPAAFKITGSFNNKAFETALNMVVQKHESLRTVFADIDGEPRQIILEQSPDLIRLNEHALENPVIKIGDFISELWNKPFDLANGPLLKCDHIRTATSLSYLSFNMHHIISDGWSLGILYKDILEAYDNIIEGNDGKLINPELHYKEFSIWQRNHLTKEEIEKHVSYWKDSVFSESIPVLELPYDYQRPEIKTYNGNTYRTKIDDLTLSSLKKVSANEGATLFMTLMAAVNILLKKVSRQNEIVIGTPVSGRDNAQLHDQIGFYINTLPVLSKIKGDLQFIDLLQATKQNILKAFEYQYFPFELLVKEIQPKRDLSRSPLFDVMLILQNNDLIVDNNLSPNVSLEPIEVSNLNTKYDLTFSFTEIKNELFLEIDYNTDLFNDTTLASYSEMLNTVFKYVIKNPSIYIKDIELISSTDKNTVINIFNRSIETTTELSINQLLDHSFLKFSKNVALKFQDKEFTYETLNDKINNTASYLANVKNLKPGTRVAMLLDRTENLLVSVLSIIRANFTYVPVDITYPENRIGYILSDSQPEIIIVDDKGYAYVPEKFKDKIIHINEVHGHKNFNAPFIDLRETAAYVLYTSGSTGEPKGVEVTHRNVIAFMKWCLSEYTQTPYQTMLATTSYCFDLSVFEMFFPLYHGKSIRILNSANEIELAANAEDSIFINTVPSLVRQLIDQKINWKNIVALNMCGEPAPKVFKQQLDYTNIEVRNLYGPTEDTVFSTVYRFKDDQPDFLPIGVPISHSHLYIMDEDQNLLPPGIEGEIYLSGESIAKGYLNKTTLTKERFLINPIIPNYYLYKTGDVGKWLPDGQIEFIGRIDDQVKVRGYRIELGEIQFHMERIEKIERACIVVKEINNENVIIGYYTVKLAITKAEIKNMLKNKLPHYMLPSFLVELKAIPMTSNGKVDKKLLPLPIAQLSVQDINLPKTQTEIVLSTVWSELLGVENIGVNDNFFELGGHSLNATKLKAIIQSKLKKSVSLSELFHNSTIYKQAKLIELKSLSDNFRIDKAAVSHSYPLSKSQERLWILTQFEEASKAYNMPAAFKVSGNFNINAFEKALNMVVEKHESLRTIFKIIDGEPRQLIVEANQNPIQIKQHINRLGNAKEIITHLWDQSFDLEKGPLLKCDYIEVNEEEKFISFNMHHIISDGWSLGILHQDVIKAYGFVINDQRIELNPLPIQYKDFSVWQKSQMTEDEIQRQLVFWKDEVFSDGIPVLELPYDKQRPAVKTYNGNNYKYEINPKILNALKKISQKDGASLFMTLFSSISVLLKKISNLNRIVIGTPVSGRNNADLHDQIGFYVNTLPLLANVSGDDKFSQLLNSTKNHILRSFDNQNFSFETLIEELQVKRDASRSALFDVMLILQTNDLQEEKMGARSSIELEPLKIINKHTKYDLTFLFNEANNALFLEIEYNTDIFIEESIKIYAEKLNQLFDCIVKDENILIKDIELITDHEKNTVLTVFNQPIQSTKEISINQLLQNAFKKYSNEIALKCDDKIFSYSEVNKKTNDFAEFITTKSKSKHCNVAILLSRTENILFSVLGILRANCTYVPVDISYPESRINYILTDSRPDFIIVDDSGFEKIPVQFKDRLIHVNEIGQNNNFEARLVEQREQIAYFIYTSGSTGEPKGVEITHRNVIAFMKWCLLEFEKTPYEVMLASTSYCFDLSVFEMILPLLQGKAIRMLESGMDISKVVSNENYLFINTVPSIVRLLIDEKINWKNVVALNMAGEAAPRIFKEQLDYKNIEVRNLYGPSEDTTYSTYYRFEADGMSIIPIGIPVGYTHLYIVDKDLNLLPKGVEGEICLSGESIAKGYLNKEHLTKEKFIINPFDKNHRLYKTGDIGKWLPNGKVEFLGRVDDQVKVRGYRIELGEIQFHLESIEEIEQAYVFVKDVNGEKIIVAYYKLRLQASKESIEEILKKKLPHYMVPSFLIEVKSFPLTSNGKIDKKTLLKTEELTIVTREYVAPRNEIDKEITEIWKTILGIEKIGIKDSFFDFGGHSLKATKVIAMIQEKYAIRLDMKTLFADPTIENLSNTLAALIWINTPDAKANLNKDEISIEF